MFTRSRVGTPGERLEWAPLAASDSFVSRPNKLATFSGNGEAKLYLGPKSAEANLFFGLEMQPVNVILYRRNLLAFLNAIEEDYLFAFREYKGGASLLDLFSERKQRVLDLPDVVIVPCIRKPYGRGETRAYLSSSSDNWSLIRDLPLSRTASYRFSRGLADSSLELRLSPIPSARSESIVHLDVDVSAVEATSVDVGPTSVRGEVEVRRGQERFRRLLLEEMPECPFTGVGDPALLRASHIKPWRTSSDEERLDPKNGINLTPSYDVLFDRGFVSFDESGHLTVSDAISWDARVAFGLVEGRPVLSNQLAEPRSEYLAFHRAEIFLA